MRQVKRWRYYCDHCKKSGGSKSSMEKHENGCIRNPNRVCGFCAALERVGGDVTRRTLQTLVVVLQERGLESLRKEAEFCPGCTFAAIVQSRQQQEAEFKNRATPFKDYIFEPKEGFIFQEQYDFKADVKSFWSEFQYDDRELYGVY